MWVVALTLDKPLLVLKSKVLRGLTLRTFSTQREMSSSAMSKFYSGRPCKYGHTGLRYTRSKQCVDCALIAKKRHPTRNNPGVQSRYMKQWQKKNRSLCAYKARTREANKKHATPLWLDSTHISEMKLIYATCPEGHHVDHIIPLNSPYVCGLHVPWNLQHLPAKENVQKSNRF